MACAPPGDSTRSGIDRSANTLATGRELLVMDAAQFKTWLSEQHGQWVLVDYWATWCGPCTEKFPLVVELEKRFRDQGLKVAAFSMDDLEDAKKVEAFLAQHGAEFSAMVRSDKMGEAFESHGIREVPTYRLFDPAGELIVEFVGEFDLQQLEQLLSSRLNGAGEK